MTFRDYDGFKSAEVFIILKIIYMMKKAHKITEVLLCGDFNLIPYSMLYEFLAKKKFDISIHYKHVPLLHSSWVDWWLSKGLKGSSSATNGFPKSSMREAWMFCTKFPIMMPFLTGTSWMSGRLSLRTSGRPSNSFSTTWSTMEALFRLLGPRAPWTPWLGRAKPMEDHITWSGKARTKSTPSTPQ